MHAVITTDGSCYPNDGTGHGGWAAIIQIDGGPTREISGGLQRNPVNPVSNNKAEFAAVLEALRALPPEVTSALIRTDSQYVMNSLTIWHPNWAARGWRTATGEPVKNRNLIETILEEMTRRTVTFVHVRGHSGDPANERCDQLAMAARQRMNHPVTA